MNPLSALRRRLRLGNTFQANAFHRPADSGRGVSGEADGKPRVSQLGHTAVTMLLPGPHLWPITQPELPGTWRLGKSDTATVPATVLLQLKAILRSSSHFHTETRVAEDTPPGASASSDRRVEAA